MHFALRQRMLATSLIGLSLWAQPARSEGQDLASAVQTALETNPEINQAVRDREAIDFERRQAQGQFLPRVSVLSSAGVRRLENSTRRSLGIAGDTLYPLEAGVRAQQILFDGGNRLNEVRRQASRADGAAWRVMERSQFIALQVARHYLDFLLQQRIVAAAEDNTAFHEKLVGELRDGVKNGSISIADQQQAEERSRAAHARLTEARQELVDAATAFRTVAGLEIDETARFPASLRTQLPGSLSEAIDLARTDNPRIREAQADLDAASALTRKARADLLPTLSLEGGARIGSDIDGFRGASNDLNASLAINWDIFNGGIRRNTVLELVRRESQARYRVEQFQRQAEDDIRVGWNALQSQTELVNDLDKQSGISDDLLDSYREQFNVGQRSLLDMLDAQNTRFNVQVRAETARFSAAFAEYKILAAANRLIESLGVTPPPAAMANERKKYHVRPATDREAGEITKDDAEAGLKPEAPTY